MIDVSKHITMAEACHSEYAIKNRIKNEPNVQQIAAMQYVAQNTFEPLRYGLGGNPIEISSFFRCDKLNELPEINGAPTGHPSGECIDLKATGDRKNADIFYYILKHNLPFNQLIWEGGTNKEPKWIHVSLRKGKNKYQVLICKFDKKGNRSYIDVTKTYFP